MSDLVGLGLQAQSDTDETPVCAVVVGNSAIARMAVQILAKPDRSPLVVLSDAASGPRLLEELKLLGRTEAEVIFAGRQGVSEYAGSEIWGAGEDAFAVVEKLIDETAEDFEYWSAGWSSLWPAIRHLSGMHRVAEARFALGRVMELAVAKRQSYRSEQTRHEFVFRFDGENEKGGFFLWRLDEAGELRAVAPGGSDSPTTNSSAGGLRVDNEDALRQPRTAIGGIGAPD